MNPTSAGAAMLMMETPVLVMPSRVPARFGASSWWEHRCPLLLVPFSPIDRHSIATDSSGQQSTKHIPKNTIAGQCKAEATQVYL